MNVIIHSQIFRSNPVRSKYNENFPLNCLCNLSSLIDTNISIEQSLHQQSSNDSTYPLTWPYSCYNCVLPKAYASTSTTLSKSNSTSVSNEETQLPNKALLSLIILIGTCCIAVALKRFRRSKFFGRTVRSQLGIISLAIIDIPNRNTFEYECHSLLLHDVEPTELVRSIVFDFCLVSANVE
jgi:hypothetical protein